MTHEHFSATDQYLCERLIGDDAILASVQKNSDAAGLPHISVAPKEGALLHILAKSIGAKRILEIGTLGGYSTIWLCRALAPGGSLVTLEYEPRHAEVAKRNLALAGFADIAEVIVGPAIESLPKLTGPFDFIFIDADKRNTPPYFEWALKLSRPGTLIFVDNVVREGKIIKTEHDDRDVAGIQKFFDDFGKDPRVTVTALQTVGQKGHDGFALALVH